MLSPMVNISLDLNDNPLRAIFLSTSFTDEENELREIMLSRWQRYSGLSAFKLLYYIAL